MLPQENTLNEIERERASYLLNMDDITYAMLSEPLVVGNNSAIAQDTYIGVFGEINLVNGLIYTPQSKDFNELIEMPDQIKFPNRKSHQVRPATLEPEITESSY